MLGGGGGKNKAIEENTRYCRIALVGPNGVIDILWGLQDILWRVRDTLYETAPNNLLWLLRDTMIAYADRWGEAIVTPLRQMVGQLDSLQYGLFERLDSMKSASSAMSVGEGALASAAGGSLSLNVSIQAIDSSDMERAVRTKIVPEIERYYRNTRTRR